jgi:hypothetical protein
VCKTHEPNCLLDTGFKAVILRVLSKNREGDSVPESFWAYPHLCAGEVVRSNR